MFFGFQDQDHEIRDAVRSLLAANHSTNDIRAAWDTPPGHLDRGPWQRLVDMGLAAIIVPEASGGLGLDERSLVMVLEEIGYAGLAAPVVESTLVAPSFALDAAEGAWFSTNLGGPYVPMATDVDVLLLRAADGTVHRVDVDDAEIAQVPTTDRARRLGAVRWEPTAGSLLCDDQDQIARAVDRGAFGSAALMVGLLRRMVELTVGYVQERRQFGVPVGSFQAVKHHLADAHMALEFARPAVHRAAWSIAVDAPSRSRDVSLAKMLTGDAARTVSRHALQCHGAIGYTVEYDLHLYLKRAWALSVEWGSADTHRSALAQELGVSPTDGA